MDSMNPKAPIKANHAEVLRNTQNGFEISFDPGDFSVRKVLIRFGSKSAKGSDNFNWSRTILISDPGGFVKGRMHSLVSVDSGQLPKSAAPLHYQVVCEVEGEHPNTVERVMTEAQPLM